MMQGQEIGEMTSGEIDKYEAELREIQRKRPNGEANQQVEDDLKKLALKVGAEPLHRTGKEYYEVVPELVHRIHVALQTASMIDACQTAAKNHEIALAAMKGTAESQRISKHTMIAAWVAAIAAWAAVILPSVARLMGLGR